jgi:hypothetical protein
VWQRAKRTFVSRLDCSGVSREAGRAGLAASNNSRFEEIAMGKQKKPRVKRKSGLTVTDAEAETKGMEDWLRTTDKPLAIKEGDGRRRQKGRGAKRRGKR